MEDPNHYEQVAIALQKTYADLMAQDVKFVQSANPGYVSDNETTWMRDARAVRQALASPGLIMGLVTHLLGVTEEE